MIRLTSLMIFFIVIAMLNSCKYTNKVFYSYTSINYDVGGGKKENLQITSKLISYDECLFEFKIRKNTNDTVFMESNKKISSVSYDTNGVYLLPYKANRYFEFDTFALNNTIIKTGNITDKELGQKFPAYNDTSLNYYKNKTPKDTTIYGQHYFYVDSLLKNKDGADSVLSKLLLFKNRNFISNYKMGLANFNDKEYCPVGYHVFYYEKKVELLGIIEDMRPLTKEENKICASMLKKVLGGNTDANNK
jgi:hypothetical protein